MTTMVKKLANALREEALKFDSPVQFYVEPEALKRYEAENGFDAAFDAEFSGRDFAAESWEILARVAIEVMREPTDEMLAAGTSTGVVNETHDIYRAMIEAALKEGQ